MIDHLEIAKWGKILGFTVFGDRADEANWTRGDTGYQKTVVLADGSIWRVWIDFFVDMLGSWTSAHAISI